VDQAGLVRLRRSLQALVVQNVGAGKLLAVQDGVPVAHTFPNVTFVGSGRYQRESNLRHLNLLSVAFIGH